MRTTNNQTRRSEVSVDNISSTKHSALNEEQRLPYLDDNNCVVVACPGSGKTRLMVAKIAKLAERDGIDSILAVTFTKASADEMRHRLASVVDSKIAKSLRIATFHAHAYRQVKSLGLRLVHEAESRDILSRARARTSVQLSDEAAAAIISRMKAKGYPFKVLENLTAREETLFQAYQETLNGLNAMDMDDMIPLCLSRYRSGEIKPYGARWLLVDEFQDTDPMQYEWLLAHCRSGATITAVGDDDQSIYGFRNALGHNVLKLLAKETSANVHFLKTNYRCGQVIVAAAANIILANAARIPKEFVAGSSLSGKIDIQVTDHWLDEADLAIAAISDLAIGADSGCTSAILARTNNLLDVAEAVATGAGLAVIRLGGSKFFARKHVSQTISAIKFGLNNGDKISLLSAASVAGLSNIAIAMLEQRLTKVRQAESLQDILYSPELTQNWNKQDVTLWREFRTQLMDWNDCVGSVGDSTNMAGQISKGLRRLCTYFIDHTSSDWKTKDLMILQQVLSERMKGPLASRLALLERNSERVTNDEKKIYLLTLHGSKGLEFDHVRIIGCRKDTLPHVDAVEEEERRLFYVGMTRAKQTLTLSYATDADGEISPFLEGLLASGVPLANACQTLK